MARLATILSFGDRADDDADVVPEQLPPASQDHREEQEQEHDEAASDASDDSFEFAFARPLATAPEADALADDLFAHGRIVPAYPVFRRQSHDSASASAATAPPSPDTFCAWTPRSAPGSPAREPAEAFPKSASTGRAVVPRFRLRDLVGSGAGRRSHSDGKEKFLFLQPSPAKPKSKTIASSSSSSADAAQPAAKKASSQKPKQQSKKKGAAVTEMDMATAHRLFYSKPGGAATSSGTERTTTTKTSYLPYRASIVGFFAAAHGLRPKHHPY